MGKSDSEVTPRDHAPKSAYELALERLDRDGIERPREDSLSPELKSRMQDARSKAEARLAELEILHRDRLAETSDRAEREKAEKNFRAERERIEGQRDRELERLRREATGRE